ncbi:MAG TPA: SPOR domain-containing protein [Woeseiaceae bacterium]|nr:SPOR domain-containing protein [Woeseiaceae bacterium]
MKERIIGAVVLVVFVVLVVPIFLDGPPEGGDVVTERVLLPGQDGQKTQTVVLDRDRTDPVPAANTPQQVTEAAREEPAQQEEEQPVVQRQEPLRVPPKPQPEPEEEQPASSPSATSTTGMWAVQVGSFGSKENADKLYRRLRAEGYLPGISTVQTSSGTMYRVRIGPQATREGAEETAARLVRAGEKDARVVPHP